VIMTADTTHETRRRAADEIKRALAFAAVILLAGAAVKGLRALGMPEAADWSHRLTMAATGAFLMVTGNAIPKTLTPLAALACDPARLQRFQRHAGWTWVLTGAALAIDWLLLPIPVAKPLTLLIVGSGIVAIVVPLARLYLLRATRRVSQRPGGPSHVCAPDGTANDHAR